MPWGGSADPLIPERGNIVLADHVGGYGKVFKDLFYVKPGDPIILYSAGRQYRYTVQERLVLPEDGVSAQQQAANERYIESTPYELVTLVTCWPANGPTRFTQRVVVHAVPSSANVGTPAHASDASGG
jgi:sortase A